KSRNGQDMEQTQDAVQIPITRINVNNEEGETNSKIANVNISSRKTEDMVCNASEIGNTSTIIIDELLEDPADEIAVEIPTSSMQLLAENRFGLHIQTDYATISLNDNAVQEIDNNHLDLYFRLIPLKGGEQRTEVSDRLPRST